MIQIALETQQRCELVEITGRLDRALQESGVREGMLLAQVMHTTAGITINENADPDVARDVLKHLERMVPEQAGFLHSEGNSDAHIKASLMGSSVSIPVTMGKLALGTWQGVFFCEFDGPRHRKVAVQILQA